MTNYNIYFGTIGKTLGCKYRFTKKFENVTEAKKFAENAAKSLYYKYEGKYGIPAYNKIIKELYERIPNLENQEELKPKILVKEKVEL